MGIWFWFVLAIIGFVFDTSLGENENSIDAVIFAGSGDQTALLVRATQSLGSLVRRVINDPIALPILGALMPKLLKKAIAGKDEDYETISVESKITKISEEEKA